MTTAADKPKPAPEGGVESLEKIRNLQRELYGREESETIQDRGDEITQLGLRHSPVPVESTAHDPVKFKDMSGEAGARRRRIIIWSVSGVVLVAIFAATIALTLWYRVRQNVTPDQMNIEVVVDKEFTSGEEIVYQINFANESFVDWQDVEVVFEPPAGFTATDTPPELIESGSQYAFPVGRLDSKARDSFSLTGRLVAEENASVVARAEIQLTPVNFPSGRFDKSALATTTVVAQPVDVSISMTQQAGKGERVLASITVRNKSGTPLTNGYIGLEPTPGLELATGDPQFTAGYDPLSGEWAIPTIESLASETYTVVLFVEGEPGEQRTLTVKVGIRQGEDRFVQRSGSAVVTISASELTVAQSYEAAASPLTVRTKQRVDGKIKYRNSGTVGLKDIIITAVIDGNGVDESSLRLRDGAYNPTTKTITWTSASVPDLALLNPQDEGELQYSFIIHDPVDFPDDDSGVNNNIIIIASIDSPDVRVPVGQERQPVTDRYVMSVASDILLGGDAFYDDGRLGITSEGPLPPEAGETTSYTVRVRLGSSLNDVGDVRVAVGLKEGVTYTEETVATTGELSFNERTNEVVWTIPKVAGGTGRISPFEDLHFQVSITPGEHQRNSPVVFLSRLSATASDLFTDIELDALVSGLPSTQTAAPGKGRVR